MLFVWNFQSEFDYKTSYYQIESAYKINKPCENVDRLQCNAFQLFRLKLDLQFNDWCRREICLFS